ncbi:DUF4344 domain-containing metallopeptidase [Caulobacter sp. NIBR1757]|uniref:DUF4344 domain-containing metallopeptidase n=1 Tax=Caulobacter sp. NIBR1757 TaxID=3016000 RepID=UPI0022F0C6DF|nr:DUF4344 domain-containing metallopeptidase [Caulobacter sp. NIBR1757]WGM37982.1 hypothetical protein AMEJIAPC_00883 [Caulobacter sp. NIBR1757]
MKRLLLAATLSLGLATSSAAQTPPPRIHLAPPQSLSPLAVSLDQFTRGTLRFVILHELGHGLVDLYDLPVLGREEDAADRFATFWMSPDSQGEDGTDAVAAMEWWLASARQSDITRDQLPWWDEHGMDEQRAYQIACLLYGASPQDFGPLAGRMGIPERSRQRCLGETAQNNTSWSKLLKGQVSQMHNLDGYFTNLTYMEPGPGTRDAAQIARRYRILEEVREIIRQFRYTDVNTTVKLTARDCGVSNAFWNTETDELTLCYELINEVAATGVAAGFH